MKNVNLKMVASLVVLTALLCASLGLNVVAASNVSNVSALNTATTTKQEQKEVPVYLRVAGPMHATVGLPANYEIYTQTAYDPAHIDVVPVSVHIKYAVSTKGGYVYGEGETSASGTNNLRVVPGLQQEAQVVKVWSLPDPERHLSGSGIQTTVSELHPQTVVHYPGKITNGADAVLSAEDSHSSEPFTVTWHWIQRPDPNAALYEMDGQAHRVHFKATVDGVYILEARVTDCYGHDDLGWAVMRMTVSCPGM